MAKFSVTDLGTFRRCRTRWNWSSNARMNLTKMGAGAPELELGGIIHRALAKWILEPDGSLAHIYVEQVNARIDELSDDYKLKTGGDISNEELAPILDTAKLGTNMMANYQKRWGTPIPNNMSFAAAEQEIMIPVPGTEHQCTTCRASYNMLLIFAQGNDYSRFNRVDFLLYGDDEPTSIYIDKRCVDCGGTGIEYHYLTGTLDGLLQDTNGFLYVLEHKTYDQRPNQIVLDMTDQFTGYCWMVDQLKLGQIRGVAYDGMWKRGEIPKGKEFNDLFLRTTIKKNQAEIDMWGQNLTSLIMDMANDPAIYPNVRWEGCYDCKGFREVCVMQLKGDDISTYLEKNYTQRKVVRIQGIAGEDGN